MDSNCNRKRSTTSNGEIEKFPNEKQQSPQKLNSSDQKQDKSSGQDLSKEGSLESSPIKQFDQVPNLDVPIKGNMSVTSKKMSDYDTNGEFKEDFGMQADFGDLVPD